MNILISAIACHPQGSSESYVGWYAVDALRKKNRLWVITDPGARNAIEDLQSANEAWREVTFLYVGHAGPFHPNRLVARLQSWLRYRHWCSEAHQVAKRLTAEITFDVAHHITYATWRMGSPLAGLNVPLVWGPLGGGESFPWHLAPQLSPVALCFEAARIVSTVMGLCSAAPREAAYSAAFILPNNAETEEVVLKLGAKKERVHRLTQSFLSKEGFARFLTKDKRDPKESGRLEIVAGGNLEGRKGVAIAIQALAVLKGKGLPFRYRFFGRGPELLYLRRLVERLGLIDHVSFLDPLGGDAYAKMLKEAHVYLLPSLREGVPVTQMEAMAAGCVPVVASCGGAGPMAEHAGMSPVVVQSATSMATQISAQLERLWNTPDYWKAISESSVEAIRQHYSSEHYAQKIDHIYEMATAGGRN